VWCCADNLTGEWDGARCPGGKRDVTLTVETRMREREQVPDFTLLRRAAQETAFRHGAGKGDRTGRAAHSAGAHTALRGRQAQPGTRAGHRDRSREQCARTALPSLPNRVKLDALLRGWPEDRALFFARRERGRSGRRRLCRPCVCQRGRAGRAAHRPRRRLRRCERAAIRALPQARAISLGPRILRGETAAIAATGAMDGRCRRLEI